MARTPILRADKADTPTEGQLRSDRAQLRRPRPQPDGSVRYDAFSSFANVPMRYAWGVEVATEEALSDPEYLEALRGLSLVTVKSAVHKNGQPINVRADARAVGSILDARYDIDDKAVVLELVVHDRETLADIEAGRTTDLSEAYVPVTAVRADGVIEQRKRRPNHVAIVADGRMPGAGLRADEDAMTEAQVKAALKEALLEQLRADAETEAQTKLKAEVKLREAAELRADNAEKALKAIRDAVGITADSDDVEATLDAKVAEMVRADAALVDEARELGIELPKDSTPATRLRDIAVALGAEAQRADSADFARAFIDGRKAAPRQTAAQRHTAGFRAPTSTKGAPKRRLS